MNKYPLTLVVSLALWLNLSAQEQVTEGAPIRVSERPLASVQQVGQDVSIATSLQSLPGVVILSQGQAVGQSDISIRGSSFSGAGLSIAGLSLRNAQTEHFHTELPFPAWWLAQPEVLTGVSQAAQTEGHLMGTVSLSPLLIQNLNRISGGVDNKSGYWVNGGSQQVRTGENGVRTGVGVFAGHSEIPGVDFPDNDVKVSRGGAQVQHLSDRGQGDLWLGHQDKTFGARGYYGVSDAFKAEERTQDTMLLGSWQGRDPGRPYSASILLRQFDDDYKLWLPSGLFRNQHRTRSAATQGSRLFLLQEGFRVQTRLAADIEDIDSDNLGDFSRSRVAATVMPQVDLTDSLTLSVGVRGELLEGDSNQVLPLARVDLILREDLVFHAEASQSVRRPSYTELNYESPGSLGNSGLAIQEQSSFEGGLTWDASPQTRLQALVFQHRTKDTVDWIRPDEDAPRWLAENIGDVDTLGTEVILTHAFHPRFQVTTSYMWMDKDADNPPYASRYSLDYAKHFVRAQIDWTLQDWLRLELSQWYRDQADNPLRTEGGSEQWLSNVALHIRCPKYSSVQFSLMVNNATNDDYRIFPGQNTVTQRRVSAGVTIDW